MAPSHDGKLVKNPVSSGATDAAPSEASGATGLAPELTHLAAKLEPLNRRFGEVLERCKERIGYNRTTSFVNGLVTLAMFLLGGALWWRTRWYWGVLAGLAGGSAVVALFGGAKRRKGQSTARVFFHELRRRPPEDPALFWAALTAWLPRASADMELRSALEAELERQVAPHRGAALDRTLAQLATLQGEEDRLAKERSERPRRELAESFNSQLASLRAAALAEAQALAPGACLPVVGLQIVLRPSFLTTFSASWRFAVSDQWFLIFTGPDAQGVYRFPMDCLKQVTVEPASTGLSATALATKLADALFGGQDMRVRVDLHLWLHWMPRSGFSGACGTSYDGISWEISESNWAMVGDAWTRLAQRRFPAAPICPACGRNAVAARSMSTAASLGFSTPRMVANCTACSAELEFALDEGAFRVCDQQG